MNARNVALLGFMMLSSCALAFGGVEGRCFVNEDCSDGLVCVAPQPQQFSGGFCVLDEPNPLTFAIDISPVPGQGVLRHQQVFSPDALFTGDTPQALLGNFTLEEAAVVTGLVAAIGVTQTPEVSISATLQEDPLIKGTGRETFFASSDATGIFSLSVRPGLYDIVATSQDPTIPPLVVKGQSLPLKPGQTLQLQLDASQKIRGVLTSNGLPLEGFRVSARAEDDLITLRSTTTITGPDGSFSLSLTPGESKLVFRYEPDASGPNNVAPTFEQLVVLSSLTTVDGFFELGSFDTGALTAPLELIGRVSGPAANLNDVQEASETTSLTFIREEAPNSTQSFSRKTTVDSNGNYSVQLLPGTYRVVAQTPAPDEFASGELSPIDFQCVAAPCPAIDLTLQRRHKVFGQIFDRGGLLIPEVFVVEARTANQPQESPVINTSSDDALRGFEALLDPGLYDLTLLPPTSGGLAPGLLFGVNALEQDVRVDAVIQPPSLLVGQIAANNNMGTVLPPIATIRVFAVSPAGDFYQLSLLTSDSDGNFAAVVPNPASSTSSFFNP